MSIDYTDSQLKVVLTLRKDYYKRLFNMGMTSRHTINKLLFNYLLTDVSSRKSTMLHKSMKKMSPENRNMLLLAYSQQTSKLPYNFTILTKTNYARHDINICWLVLYVMGLPNSKIRKLVESTELEQNTWIYNNETRIRQSIMTARTLLEAAHEELYGIYWGVDREYC